jgi:hypothetical protein
VHKKLINNLMSEIGWLWKIKKRWQVQILNFK